MVFLSFGSLGSRGGSKADFYIVELYPFWLAFGLINYVPMGPLFHACSSSPGRSGSVCAQVGLGWFICFFFFPCLFRVRPLRARCVSVGVLSWFLLSFFAFPVSWSCSATFIPSSSSSHFHFPVTLIFTSQAGLFCLFHVQGGQGSIHQSVANEATDGWKGYAV